MKYNRGVGWGMGQGGEWGTVGNGVCLEWGRVEMGQGEVGMEWGMYGVVNGVGWRIGQDGEWGRVGNGVWLEWGRVEMGQDEVGMEWGMDGMVNGVGWRMGQGEVGMGLGGEWSRVRWELSGEWVGIEWGRGEWGWVGNGVGWGHESYDNVMIKYRIQD